MLRSFMLGQHREDLDTTNPDIECVFIELDKGTFNSNVNIIVGVVYRPSDKNNNVVTTVVDIILKTIPKRTVYVIRWVISVSICSM